MEKLLNAMPLLTSLALALVFAIGLAWQGMALREAMNASAGGAQRQVEADQQQRAPAESVELGELTFFGKPGDNATPRVTETEDLPETNLQLVLRGVMAGDTEQRDSALVEGPNGETEVYRVSESLPGNAVLRKVHQKRIVIERGGTLETLSFPEDEPGDSMTVASTGTANAASARSGTSASNSRNTSTGSSSRRSRERDEDVRERLNRLRERLSDN